MCSTEACGRAECYRLVPRTGLPEVISAVGIDYRRITLVFYRKRAFENECAVRCSGALSIKPLEGSRSRVRRTRDAMGIQSISA